MNVNDDLNNQQQQKGKHHKVLPNVHPTNSLILPDGKIFKVQKKRQRKIHSCIPCHQRKIKCSRETPTCLNCLKLAEKNPAERFEILEACKYFDNDKKKNLKKKGVNIISYNKDPTLQSTTNGSDDAVQTGTIQNFNDDDLNSSNASPHMESNNDDNLPLILDNTPQYYTSNNDVSNTNDNDNYLNQYDNSNTNCNTNVNSDVSDLVNKNQTKLNNDGKYNLVEDSINMKLENNDDNNNTNNNTTNNTNNNNDITNNSNNNGFPMDQNDFVYIPRDESNYLINESDPTNPIYQPQKSQGQNPNPNPNLEQTQNLLQNQNGMYADEQIYSYYSKQFASQFITILNNLPTKERSDELLKNFQTNVHALLPILDMKSFLEKYNEFWYCGLFLTDNIEKLYQYVVYFKDKFHPSLPNKINDFLYWYNKSTGVLNPSNFSEFLILLYAVYYTSISSSVYEFLSKKYDNFNNILSYKNEVNKYYNMFKKMNHKGLNNPRVMSLAVLQINVLVQSLTNLKSGNSLINISKILRICQFYQLNRDPVLYHALKDKELVQTRRIVWWQIFLLDNLVSFFLNLTPSIKLSDFDTSLLMENLDNDSSSNFSIMYLNCMYRFILIVDDLNGLTNGLNFQLKNEDINKMKNNINNLFITCNTTMRKMSSTFYAIHNTTEIMSGDNNSSSHPSPNINQSYPNTQNTPNSGSIETQNSLFPINNNFHEPSLDTFRFFMSSLNILSDKMLIMLQKKILLSPYLMYDTHKANSNLNLRLSSTEYSYTDLQNNLLPSLLHYLDTFLLLSKKDMLKFNWKLKNYIPIDELILLMNILVTNYKSGANQTDYDPYSDMNLKIYLIGETLNSLKLNWHLKLSSVNKLISLASKLWELMILKFNIDLQLAYSLSDKYIFPKPIHDVINPGASFSRNINISSNSVSCAEIAPRTIGIASAIDTPLRHRDSKKSHNISKDKNTPHTQVNGTRNGVNGPTVDMTGNVKERFLTVAKLIEDELSKEGGSGIIQDTDENEEGWFNLGTEEEYGLNSIDDFHFYKNLKSDVIRLFKLVIC